MNFNYIATFIAVFVLTMIIAIALYVKPTPVETWK